MGNIQILDCTLRDGGYCNQWNFGVENISKIINKLDEAQIDIIEGGFLTDYNNQDKNLSRFKSIQELGKFIRLKKTGLLVLMANYGEYDFDNLPPNTGIIDGIRIAFHKDSYLEVLKICKAVKAKGYLVFIQPMVSLRYTQDEFFQLMKQVNEIEPYAFYIVDSFGSMKREELKNLYMLADKTLCSNIRIGFHAHNNIQMARANAEWLIEHACNRKLIIDSSVCGMGRGAGNLNTELLAEYLNFKYDKSYKVKSLLEIIDEIILDFYDRKSWGYSLPNFLSAKYNVHPNYADFLERKKTLTLKEMCEIFERIPVEKRYEYDAGCIENLYLNYMDRQDKSSKSVNELRNILGEEVIIIAPGKTAEIEKDKIQAFIKRRKITVISVNFVYKYATADYIFISNIRRFKQVFPIDLCIIATSNIEEDVEYKIPYKKYLNQERGVEDNAALMLIKLLIDCNVKKIYIAGLDGYSYDMDENYMDKQLQTAMSAETIREKNLGLKKVLIDLKSLCSLEFITTEKNIITEG